MRECTRERGDDHGVNQRSSCRRPFSSEAQRGWDMGEWTEGINRRRKAMRSDF